MSGCCDDFVPGGRGGGGGGGGLTNAIQTISGGTTNATGPGVSFANGNNVSFGVDGNTITASVAAGIANAIRTISGGTTNATGPAISFANGSGVSFGVNGNTITASIASSLTGINVSAGTTSNNLSAVTFANGGGVSFGLNASTITASIASSLTAINLSAGTTSNNLSAVTFANGNGVSFGLNASTITASHAVNVSAGTTSNNLSALTFANGSNVSFGLNGSTLTASVNTAGVTVSQFAPFVGKILELQNLNNGSFLVAPYVLPNNLTFSQLNQVVHWSANAGSNGTASFTYNFAAYTKNASTLSLLHSTSFTSSIPYAAGASSATYNGIRLATIAWSSSMSAGEYWFGIGISSTISSDNASIRMLYQQQELTANQSNFSGILGVVSNASNQMQLGYGAYSAITAAAPASIAFTDLRGSLIDRLTPAFGFGQTV